MPPGVGYYGGAPNAFAGGGLFQQDRRARDYQENALRSLIDRFGPEAGDPTAWSQVQDIVQSRRLFPYEIEAQEHQSALRPHQLAAAERTTDAYDALVEDHGAVAGDPTAQGINAEMNAELRGAALNAARFLQTAKSRGLDLGEAYDRVQGILPHLGIPDEGVAAIREQIVADPDSVDELAAMLSGEDGSNRAMSAPIEVYDEQGRLRLMQPMRDGSYSFIEGVTPARGAQADVRLGQRDRALTNEEARMRGFDATPGHQYYETPDGEIYARPVEGTEESREAEDRRRKIEQEEQERITAAEEVVERSDLALQSLDNTLSQLDRFGAVQGDEGPVGRGSRTIGGLPGVRAISDVGRYQDEVETLLSHVAIDRLASIKATGATLGQITAPELAMLRASMGNLEAVGRDPELIREDLATIRRILEKARRNAQQDLEAADEDLIRRYNGNGNGGGG